MVAKINQMKNPIKIFVGKKIKLTDSPVKKSSATIHPLFRSVNWLLNMVARTNKFRHGTTLLI
jgi:hypothetical protein